MSEDECMCVCVLTKYSLKNKKNEEIDEIIVHL